MTLLSNLSLEQLVANASNVTYTPTALFQRQSTLFMGCLYFGLTVFSYISNSFFLFVHFKTPGLRSSFSVYMVSLAISDLCKSLTNGIQKTTNNLQIRWFLGDGYCLLTIYCANTVTSIIMYIHVLISINRFWAVMFPNNYRTHHNIKVAVCLVIAAVLFVNVWSLPGFITDDLYHRSPEQIRMCLIAFGIQKSVYFYIYGTVVHLLPQAAVLVLYPFIYFKVKSVMQKKGQIGLQRTATNESSLAQSTKVTQASTAVSLEKSNNVEMQTKKEKEKNHALQKLKAKLSGTRHFAVLTALLISATLFWTPTHLAYILMMTGKFVDFRFLGAANFLFALDCTMNPILCILASEEWRSAVKTVFRRR